MRPKGAYVGLSHRSHESHKACRAEGLAEAGPIRYRTCWCQASEGKDEAPSRAPHNKSFGYPEFLARFLCLIEQPIPPFMEKLGSGFITTTDDVDRLEFDWGKIHFLSEPQVTNAERFSFGIVELAQGQGHARHNHPGSEEIIYVVSGEGEQMVDDQPAVKVGPGASIYIPADIYHSTLNTGNEPMKLIVVYSPAGPERLLREIPGCKVTAPR